MAKKTKSLQGPTWAAVTTKLAELECLQRRILDATAALDAKLEWLEISNEALYAQVKDVLHQKAAIPSRNPVEAHFNAAGLDLA